MIREILRWVLAGAMVFMLSCGGQQRPLQKTGSQEQHEHFDPMSLDDDVSLADILGTESSPAQKTEEFPGMGTENPSKNEDTESPADSTQVEAVQMEETSGWRVQIFASDQFGAAQKAKEAAMAAFGVPVYVPFETPYYKVRIGNCRSLAEAENLVREAKRKGYRTAFRARTTILVEKRSPE
ncbi:MAG: SPOR domain-containing protein [Candidatus Latescibacterota bacterium]